MKLDRQVSFIAQSHYNFILIDRIFKNIFALFGYWIRTSKPRHTGVCMWFGIQPPATTKILFKDNFCL